MIKKNILTALILVAVLTFSQRCMAKTYKIACLNDYSPYSFVDDNNELRGILIDWWRLWEKKTGVDIVFIPTDIEGCMNKTLRGEVDIISGLSFNEELTDSFDYSENIIMMNSVLFLSEDLKIEMIDQLNIPVGVVKNDFAYLYLQKNYPSYKLLVFDSYSALRYAIKQQELKSFIYEVPSFSDGIKESLPEGYGSFKVLLTNSLRHAVKKGNKALLNLIVEGDDKISNKELLNILNQWKEYSTDDKVNQTHLIIGALIIAIILIFFYFLIKSKTKKKKDDDFAFETNWEGLIAEGENDFIEFKSSLRWDYQQEKLNKGLEGVIIKTISAFLNSRGGTLFIGVDDDGNILGLENDYSTFSKKNSDGFLLTLTNLINQNLGKQTHQFITINIVKINEMEICVIVAQKSKKPVFIAKNGKEEFYIRASASSQPMGLREAHEYISLNWE